MIRRINKNLTRHRGYIALGALAISVIPLMSLGQKCSQADEVQALFTHLKNNGFDEKEPVDYHYFFIDSNPKDIVQLKEVLIKQDYRYIGVARIAGRYQLEVSRKEAHSASTAIERTKELKALAGSNNVEVFDGFELKLLNNIDNSADFRKEIGEIPPPQLFRKAMEFYDRSDTQRALAAFDRCISLGINPVVSYYRRGNCKTTLGKVNEAIADLETAIRLNPKHYDANLNLGSLYIDKENYDRAISYYQNAVAINPKNDNGLYRLAEAYQKKGMIQLAIDYCEKSLAINPNNPYAQELLKKLN